ncbi:MAG: ABC transporter substrate-binding protein [Anaerovoracaceae bacterium]
MKKRLAVLLVLVMVVSAVFVGCGDKAEGGKPDADAKTIGIIQIQEHPSLDQIRTSIVDQLAADGYVDGKNIIIDYKNAQNDPNNLKTICQTFKSKGVDLIIAIATPSAQSALGETTDIPIIFSAVTDPIEAELVKSLENPGGNITGTSDKVSAEQIMDLAKKITPEMKTIGALYNSGEANSVSVIGDLKAYAKKNNLKVIESTVTNTSEVQQAAQYLAGKVDAVFSPIDNTVASAMPIVTEVFGKDKIPFYVSADSMVKDGGLATYGIDYTILGQETAKMVAKVLEGESPATMAIKTMEDMKIYVNTKTADSIGITIPEAVLKDALDLSK